MTAPNLFVRGQGIEDELKRIWQRWCRAFPHDAAVYMDQVKRERQQLYVSSGMSKEGTFAYTGSIPDRIYFVILHRWPDFFKDPKNLMTAQRIFMGEDNMPKPRKRLFEIKKKETDSE